MLRLGIWIMIFGFGSIALQAMDMHFVILAWADEMQPYFGIFLGFVGVLVALISFITKASDRTDA
ncbi:hypothetical protein [Nocardia huaxiensis]|uniref:Uncharacterized protein n=1 Tax=Nocardia huaxiensis TaxID=2755382 RepID=A0A7D6VBV3_9NOCA|nr:hypothetical protein [Nocardia huaxiensis]QLY31313.1 hypothetical protein H0264_02815 [Nocardia huaxiensis]UFS94856.1 hypothetical protein LPY97_29650 [Nocardia huaxiensis]